jgi:aspartyl-tRNA(Asn)/glutamyl-tRNA(Gln) amidotransferase subunit A
VSESISTTLPQTASEAAAALRAGTLTSVQLTSAMLARADRLDPVLGTYLARFDDLALSTAERADAELARGLDKGPLHGIPVGVKDILAMREGPTTANSLVLDRAWGAGRDAPVVRRLKDAGAVITGKVTTFEFATGWGDESKPFPIPRNPWDLATWPGGSSCGTGNGIAAGMFFAGIGTDTGGSIRIPAACCGVTGLKPTYGRVPKSGCVPFAYSLDTIGPLARSAHDCAAMLSVIAGHHRSDESASRRPVDDYVSALTGAVDDLRIGVDRRHHLPAGADPDLAGCLDAALATLAELGAEVVEIELPCFEEVDIARVVTQAAEALAYHRGDLGGRWNDYFERTRMGIARGALVTGADLVQAQRVRRVAQHRMQELFEQVDLVAMPTIGLAAPRVDELAAGRVDLISMLFTSYWNALGLPAMALPMGFQADGLPLSLQLAGRPFAEATVLRAGDAYQRATEWHLQLPPLVDEGAR